MTATVVLGMHRSGTSLMAQLLHGGGMWLGCDDDLAGPAPDNEDGFWEHRAIVDVNDRLLRALGWSWDQVGHASAMTQLAWDDGVRVDAKELVAALWQSDRPWGWKDPRTTVTLPFWRELVDDLRVVVAVRDPLEVASSLLKRNGIALEDGLRLWRTYMEHARQTTGDLPRLVVHYAALLAAPEREASRLLDFAGLDRAIASSVAGRVKPQLRHHTNDHRELALQPGPVLDLYEEWISLAGDAVPTSRTDARLEAVVDRVVTKRLEQHTLDLGARMQRLQQQLGALARTVVTSTDDYDGYRQLLAVLVHAVLPEDADVLVVSKGDPALLDLPVARARHLPADENGQYPGHHPACSLTLVAQLEVGRSTGATHLFVPAAYRWYLDHYAEFRTHLERRYTLVLEDSFGVVYDIGAIREAAPHARLIELVKSLTTGIPGQEPSVLDWVGLDCGSELDGVTVCPAQGQPARLPYLDDSIDVVVRSDTHPLPEAARIARTAVVTLSGDELSIEHLAGAHRPATASIVIPAYGKAEMTVACVRAVLETVDGVDVEIIVVDDASPDDTAARIGELAGVDRRVRLVQNEKNSGFITSCNNGAAAATHGTLVFLNNDTVPLPGWLQPLLHLLWSGDDVGAVGGMLLFADGTLQEAGGAIFNDGSGANVGRHATKPDHPNFAFVREVDYCSGALLATRRDIFEALGGFDDYFTPAYYEDTDYCFRLRRQGLSTLYQPRSVVVHLEGATSGTDVTAGVKQHQVVNHARFVERWRDELRHHPDPPDRYTEETWNHLVGIRPQRRTR